MAMFWSLQHKWWEFLTHTWDIYSDANLAFLRSLQKVSMCGYIPDELFYLQEEAGFFRFRVLEILWPQWEKYQVNFHVFPDSKTHIHSHGYAANSWLLWGELEYANFVVHDDISEKSKEVFWKLFWGKNLSCFSDIDKQIVNREMWQLLMWGNIKPSFRTNAYAAMVWEWGLFSNVEAWKRYRELVKNNQDFWILAKPEDVMWVVQNGERIFRLEKTSQRICQEWDTYHFSEDVAHAVDVTWMAVTLFITCKRHDLGNMHEGEFHHFPKLTGVHEKPLFVSKNIKQEILWKLQSIKI